ncbi:MAG TPA: SAM-dependent methyltransferase, partial [Aequorivita sp.]|nr:SAM-dependent methyltransferase [Aequorivita sp.]
MKRTLFKTGDGSYTLHIPEWDEQYHSKHGAIAEALHVFIKEGLYHWLSRNSEKAVSILEIGFGTGLNAFLTYLETEKNSFTVHYTAIEAFPLEVTEVQKLNYTSLLTASEELFL